MPYQALLLDIEGTTTSIRFVYDALFPFARRELRGFLARNFSDPLVAADAMMMWDDDDDDAVIVNAETATLKAEALMDGDVKNTGLKALQGRVWRAGYDSGELKGHIYADVPDVLRAHRQENVPVFIYSSGSVAAQKLLFGNSEAGDLMPLLSGYFDTTTGPKKDADSYWKIAQSIDQVPAAIMFVTDSLDEAIAARQAGMQVTLSLRPGNAPLPEHDFDAVTDLSQL